MREATVSRITHHSSLSRTSPLSPEYRGEGERRSEETMANKPRSASIHPGPGFRVKMNFSRLPADLMAQFKTFPSPDLPPPPTRLYAVSPDIRCMTSPSHQLVGPALTVKVFPGDNLMVHKCLDVAEPGDVVVIDAG